MSYNIHSDFKQLEKNSLPLYPLILPVLNKLIARKNNRIPLPDGIHTTKQQIVGYENGEIELTFYKPDGIRDNAPCLIYLHGGAFALQAAPYHINLVCEYAKQTPCIVVFVDYRLSPKHAFPTGIEDAYCAFKWVVEHAESLGIDQKRIAVAGDSAGAALATAVTLMARDRKAPHICFQLLMYPVTDARQKTESIAEYTDTPMWNAKLNEKMWKLYLKNGVGSKKSYASPIESDSLADLPDAYVEVAEFDPLRDEGIHYAEALQDDGVHVELNRTSGTVHGYDMVEGSELVRENVAKRISALQKTFY
ncbi:alpha/beta hydrolase [Bacillus sp. JCM 19041]|uniref:alpha/beta hydrolase n=1 Tax=Bacillus sp. JCM 19041 TaxID=1460637 RepID=UPI0006D22128